MKKPCLIVLIILLLLSGCGVGNEKSISYPDKVYQNIAPNLVQIGDSSNYTGYYYLVDKNTHVVYLVYDSYYKHAISVMLDQDGKPILAEDLGIEMEVSE